MSVRSLDIDRDLPVSSNLRLYNVLEDTNTRDEFLNVFDSIFLKQSAIFSGCEFEMKDHV